MKKILLATALAAVSLNSTNAAAPTASKYSPTGNGFYIALQAGGGKLFADGDLKAYDIDEKGRLKLKEGSGGGSIWLPSIQFNWGYSHRFPNDMTLGFEATVISPALRFGYMINDRRHLVLGAHYGLTSRLVLTKLFDYLKEDLTPTEKDLISLNLDALAGLGGSLSYEYFTESKNFFRIQIRLDWYGVEAKLAPNLVLKDKSSLPFVVSGKGSVWDAYIAIGFGSQW